MKTTQLSKVAPAPDGNPQSPVLRWCHALQGMVLMLCMSFLSVANACTSNAFVGSTTTRVNFPAMNVSSRAPNNTFLTGWRRGDVQLYYSCAAGEVSNDVFLYRSGGATTTRSIMVDGQNFPLFDTGVAGIAYIGRVVLDNGTTYPVKSSDDSDYRYGPIRGGAPFNYTADIEVRLIKVGDVRAGSIAKNSAAGFDWSFNSRFNAGVTNLNISSGAINVINATCDIVALPVTLPEVVARSLSVAGSSAGEKRFSIRLNNCSDNNAGVVTVTNARNVRVYFDGPAVDAASGRLNIDTGGAGNVQLQLLNDNAARSVINLAGTTGTQNVDTLVINAGSVTLPYIARYYATGSANPGTVNTRVNFTVEYP